MKSTRRGFIQSAALAAAARPQTARPAAQEHPHRTQFDAQLLAESFDPLIAANHGRQMRVLPNGDVETALAWGGSKPRIRRFLNRETIAEYPLEGTPSAPIFSGEQILYSVGNT